MQPYIESLFEWTNDLNTWNDGRLIAISIEPRKVSAVFDSGQRWSLVLHHLDDLGDTRAVVGRNFAIKAHGEGGRLPPGEISAKAAALVVSRDKAPADLVWSRCGEAVVFPAAGAGQPDPDLRIPVETEAESAPEPKAPLTPAKGEDQPDPHLRDPMPAVAESVPDSNPPIRPVVWLMAAVAAGMAVVWLAIVVLAGRLDRRAAAQERLAGASRPLHAPKFTRVLTRVAPLMAFFVLALASGDLGLNDEMVASLNLYPCRFVDPAAPGTVEKLEPCHGSFFRQEERPVFGVCRGTTRWPLLFNSYTGTVAYWPLIVISRVCPPLAGLSLRWFALVYVAGLFWIWSSLLRPPNGSIALTVLVPVLLVVLYPTSAMMGTLYAYEYVPVFLVFFAWYLLLRWNRGGSPSCAISAAFLLGLAIYQKATSLTAVLPFVAAFAVFYGLRQLRRMRLLACVAAASLGPIFLLLVNHLYSPSLRQFSFENRPTVPVLESALNLGSWLLGFLSEGSYTPGWLPRVMVLLLVVVYSFWKIRDWWVNRSRDTAAAFSCAVLVGALAGLILLYRHNPTSFPLLQILPFFVVVLASGVVDLWRSVVTGTSSPVLRHAFTALIVGGLAVAGAIQWRQTVRFYRDDLTHLVLAEQRTAARVLEELGAVELYLPNSYFNGVFEFISHGRVRPIYLRSVASPLQWSSAIVSPGTRPKVFLFSDERVVHDQQEPAIRKAFLAAAIAPELVDFPSRGGGPLFAMYRIEADVAADESQ